MSVMMPSSSSAASHTGAGAHGAKAAAAPASAYDRVSVSKRLQQELMQLMMSGNPDVSAFPEGDNLLVWAATVKGAKDTIYQGLTFKLRIVFPADYPFTAPTITFTTPCWHPNVDAMGNICVDFLKDKWSAAYSVSTLLLSLQSLLADPYPASPLNPQAAQLWEDQVEYRKVLLRKYKEATGSAPDA